MCCLVQSSLRVEHKETQLQILLMLYLVFLFFSSNGTGLPHGSLWLTHFFSDDPLKAPPRT